MRLHEVFTNRETAIGIWLVIAFSLGLSIRSIRQCLVRVLKAFFHLKVISIALLVFLYCGCIVLALWALHLWNITLLKDTAIWLIFSGIALVFNFLVSSTTEASFKSIMLDNVKVIVIIEFISNTYTLSLAAELILVPIVVLIGMLDSVARLDSKHGAVARITAILQAIIGLVIIIVSIVKAAIDYQNFLTFNSLRSLLLPAFLSVSIIPLIFVLLLILVYEQLFVRLKNGVKKDRALIRYAKIELIKHLGISYSKIRVFMQTKAIDLLQIQKKNDVDSLFA